MRVRPLLGAAVVAALFTAPSSAPMRAQAPVQDASTPDQPSFRVEANFVRVDVYPTGANGAPVTDLKVDDFELLEDGTPQALTQFEYVALSTTTAREARRDPVSAADGMRQAADPRRRVYVIYLDTWHTTFEGAIRAHRPLVDMLERLVGPDDLFAVVTPDRDPRAVTFARRTEAIDDMLRRHTTWGQRDALFSMHPEEQQLEMCYPANHPGVRCSGPGGTAITQPQDAPRGIATQLIRRRREDEVLTSLEHLVRFLGTVREERKALVIVTSGYEMFDQKPDLVRPQECQPTPTPGRPGTGPDGRITGNVQAAQAGPLAASTADCFARAMKYAMLNNRQRFMALTQEANRYNVTFYPFDTRGLVAADRSLADRRDQTIRNDPGEWYARATGTAARGMLPDQARLSTRLDSLRMLAENTDGIAVIDTNDLAAGARRIVQDVSSYYLLGYYSTNDKIDGHWRTIKVRVKRPGVQVRARRGYRALRPEDMATATAAARAEAAGGVEESTANAESAAVSAALGSVAGIRDDQPWRSRAAWFFHAAQGSAARAGRLWVTTDLDASALHDGPLAQGGTLAVAVASPSGETVAQAEAALAPGARTLTIELATSTAPTTAGDLLVRLRLTPVTGGLPLTDTVRVALPAADAAVATPRLARASPSTRRRFVPTADLRFRRHEKVRVEAPVAPGATGATAELLDRAGQVMAAIPVTAALVRPDDAGVGWATADVPLAPLSVGDYLVRLQVARGDSTEHILTAVRVVP